MTNLQQTRTTREAAKDLCVSYSTLMRLIEKGKLSTIQLTPGGKTFVTNDSIERLISNSTKVATCYGK